MGSSNRPARRWASRGDGTGGEQSGSGSREVLAPHPWALALGTVLVQRPAEPAEACLLGPVRVSSEGVSASRPTSSLQVGSFDRSLTAVHFHNLPFSNFLVFIPGQLRDCLTTDEGVSACIMGLCPPSPFPRFPSSLVL